MNRKRRVYILKIGLKEETLYKIGITGRRLHTRIIEIIASFLHTYGYAPSIEILRGDKTKHRTHNWSRIEADLLAMFSYGKIDWSGGGKKRVDGHSEYRRVDEKTLLLEYDKIIKSDGNKMTEHKESLEDGLEDIKSQVSNDGLLEEEIEAVFVEMC